MTKKRCIILSYGPVPTPENTKVEGGGLRCWGLAKGLQANDANDVTVAYHGSYRQQNFTEEYESIHVTTWEHDTVAELISGYDSVVVSYCMGELSVRVADSVRADQQLVLDCYVPIYVEVSARESEDIDSEYNAFHQDVERWDHVLRRGDVYLCASKAQKGYYKGVLSALGRLNPVTYHDEMIMVVPYGIYRDKPKVTHKPITKRLKQKGAKKILWFGGIYPWFDLRVLVDAIVDLNKDMDATLMIVGAKNPFNTHPDFVRKYDELLEYIRTSGASKYIELEDWIQFEDRANWYLDSDIVVVVNQEGPENELAWRTRLVDFTWANLPIITNGGDPLGEELLAVGAAARFSGLTREDMATDLLQLLRNPEQLGHMQENLEGIRESLYWDVTTKKLSDTIAEHVRASDFSRYGFYDVIARSNTTRSKIQRVASKARHLPEYARKHGLRTTYSAVQTIAARQVRRRLPVSKQGTPHVVIISHQLDMSGAPFVIIDFVVELRDLYPDLPMEFYTFNPVHSENITKLNKHGIRPKILIDRDAVVDFRQGDVVIFNTSAQAEPLKSAVFSGLENDRLAKLLWYVHEDEAEYIFTNNQEIRRIKALMRRGKLQIVTPAIKTQKSYEKLFEDTEHVSIQYYKLVTPKKFHRVLEPKDFSKKISFILPGTMNDGRKGQLPVFYAFTDFLHNYYEPNPDTYRDFELVFVGVTEDFMSRQILNHASKALGIHIKTHGRVTKEEHLDLMQQSNMTLCYSMREALPLFVFEGMTAGHPILRNDCSGVDEQLFDGKNGYLLDSSDYEQIVSTIERVLNRNKTSDELLARMSKEAYKVAKAQEKNSYKQLASLVDEALRDNG